MKASLSQAEFWTWETKINARQRQTYWLFHIQCGGR